MQCSNSNLTEIRLVRAVMTHSEGQEEGRTDKMKVTDAFCEYADAPKNV